MIAAWDYRSMCRELGNAFRYRYKARAADGPHVRMVGLLFAPPEVGIAREQILPGLDYFHHRSGDNIDFFCAGYRRYGPAPGQGDRVVSGDQPPWIFSLESFDRFRRDIEGRSRWRYSGEADLILLNASPDGAGDDASLDFTSAIVCDLERMTSDKAISGVRRFFEDIFRFTETTASPDPTWGFSDAAGVRAGGSALKRVILALLPKDLGEDYRRAEHFAIRDLNHG